VYPLVVVGGVGEGVDAVLGDLVPFALTEVFADEGFDLVDAVGGAGHRSLLAGCCFCGVGSLWPDPSRHMLEMACRLLL
jgi:hypothetical protein